MALVTIGIYSRPWNAIMIQGRLEEEGIPAYITDSAYTWLDHTIACALGWTKVQVSPADYDNARAVLDSIESGTYSRLVENAFPESIERCPQCEAMEISATIPLSDKLFLCLCAFGFGVIFPLRKYAKRCRQCGHQWKD